MIALPHFILNRIVKNNGLGNALEGQMAVAGEVWDDPPQTCYWPGAPVEWDDPPQAARLECPLSSGRPFCFSRPRLPCTDPPMHARLALASWYEVRHGEVWDDPPLRRA